MPGPPSNRQAPGPAARQSAVQRNPAGGAPNDFAFDEVLVAEGCRRCVRIELHEPGPSSSRPQRSPPLTTNRPWGSRRAAAAWQGPG